MLAFDSNCRKKLSNVSKISMLIKRNSTGVTHILVT